MGKIKATSRKDKKNQGREKALRDGWEPALTQSFRVERRGESFDVTTETFRLEGWDLTRTVGHPDGKEYWTLYGYAALPEEVDGTATHDSYEGVCGKMKHDLESAEERFADAMEKIEKARMFWQGIMKKTSKER